MAETTYCLVADRPGDRLDRFIAEKRPELSRTYVQKLIESGYITVNGHPARSGLKLNPGDNIAIVLPPPPPVLSPEAMPLEIVYEDKDVVVVNKPAGLTAHPAPGHPEHTLVNALLARFPHLADMGSDLRPGIVHRLDRDTSGVMVVAKNAAAQAELVAQFKSRSVVKTYLVLVQGRLTPAEGIIDAPIGRDPAHRQRMAVVDGGRPACTDYKVIKYQNGYSLLEVRPETGRTHQIRVHLAAIGYPVIGDGVYGVKSPFLSRQFVHAYRLAFRLPATGQRVEFEAELPEDLAKALEKIA